MAKNMGRTIQFVFFIMALVITKPYKFLEEKVQDQDCSFLDMVLFMLLLIVASVQWADGLAARGNLSPNVPALCWDTSSTLHAERKINARGRTCLTDDLHILLRKDL
ncbi:hypothetical protein C4D60_Mb05t25710 [Musa balbisiana]|uniref:Uncharacterized protein n=1 Tax=Musa balbisiana TaxID=52838 RepID=A0A4S8JYX1_MUSBA|nr:hypothetical protein C4D60_Mb05t25710 [Musa balbisiana]